MSRFIRMRAVFRIAFGLALLSFLVASSGSLASEMPASDSPAAMNAWAGVDMLSNAGGGVDGTTLSGRVGGDVGFRFSRQFSLVGVADYQVFLDDEGGAPWLLLLAPGLRWQPESPFQYTFAAGYVRSSGSSEGVGVRAIAFWPVLGPLGPYSQMSFNFIGFSRGQAGQVIDFTLGISFSF